MFLCGNPWGVLNSVINLYALRAIQYLKTSFLEIQILDGFGTFFCLGLWQKSRNAAILASRE
jgi:hypothetical protein